MTLLATSLHRAFRMGARLDADSDQRFAERSAVLDYTPDEVEIKLWVSVRNAIAEICDAPPRGLRMAIPEYGWEFAGSLGERLEPVECGVLHNLMAQEDIAAA